VGKRKKKKEGHGYGRGTGLKKEIRKALRKSILGFFAPLWAKEDTSTGENDGILEGRNEEKRRTMGKRRIRKLQTTG